MLLLCLGELFHWRYRGDDSHDIYRNLERARGARVILGSVGWGFTHGVFTHLLSRVARVRYFPRKLHLGLGPGVKHLKSYRDETLSQAENTSVITHAISKLRLGIPTEQEMCHLMFVPFFVVFLNSGLPILFSSHLFKSWFALLSLVMHQHKYYATRVQMPRDKSKRRDGGPTSGAVARAVGARCRVQTHGYLTAIP